MSMAAVGISINLSELKSMGYKPFVVGFIAAITVGIVSIISMETFLNYLVLEVNPNIKKMTKDFKFKLYYRKSSFKKDLLSAKILFEQIEKYKPRNFLEVGVCQGVTSRNYL